MDREGYMDSVRLNRVEQDRLLDQLDQDQNEANEGVDRPSNRREHERLAFRQSEVAIVIEQPAGGATRLLVSARNLSPGGMSFLHGGFLYVGSPCQVELRTRDGEAVEVPGKIAGCRHVNGRLHEIGVQFTVMIELGYFL